MGRAACARWRGKEKHISYKQYQVTGIAEAGSMAGFDKIFFLLEKN
jgi:hypothetical protein